jgi:hypothetical protein
MIGFRFPDARGWIAIGCYSLVVVVLAMILFDRKLLDSDAFLILATAIVITGWNGGPVGWAYQATKGGGEQAESSARIAESVAGIATPVPVDAAQAARQTADAADSKAEQIERAVP